LDEGVSRKKADRKNTYASGKGQRKRKTTNKFEKRNDLNRAGRKPAERFRKGGGEKQDLYGHRRENVREQG